MENAVFVCAQSSLLTSTSRGLYPSVEHFDKDFIAANFPHQDKNGKQARWKVPGSPRGGGGLTYLGDDISAYKGLNWQTLEPAIKQYVQLLEPEIALDTRKMSSTAGFKSGIFSTEEKPAGREMPLQAFIQQRQAYLLNHPAIVRPTQN